MLLKTSWEKPSFSSWSSSSSSSERNFPRICKYPLFRLSSRPLSAHCHSKSSPWWWHLPLSDQRARSATASAHSHTRHDGQLFSRDASASVAATLEFLPPKGSQDPPKGDGEVLRSGWSGGPNRTVEENFKLGETSHGVLVQGQPRR